MSVSRSLLLWFISAGGFGVALGGPELVALPSLVVGSAAGLVAVEQTRKTQLRDWALELWDLGYSVGTLTATNFLDAPTVPLSRIEALPVSVRDWLSVSAVDPVTPEFWTTKLSRTSKIYVGARGSGKSVLVNFHLTQMVEAGIDVKVSDRHYPNGEFTWLPGVDRATLEDRFLLRTADDTYQALLHLQETLHNRIEGISKDTRPKHLVIDEWGGLLRKWTPQQTETAVGVISFIFDEGRKYGIDVSLVCHGLTREKTALDEATTGSADLYLMGDAISQTTYTYPASLNVERKRLLSARLALVAQVSPPQRVLIYRNALSGEAFPVVAPDLSTPTPLEVALSADEWVRLNGDRIEALRAEGRSLRKISDALKVKRAADNPQWLALKAFFAEINEPPQEVTPDV